MIDVDRRPEEDLVPVTQALPGHALEVLAYLRDHEVEAEILGEIVPQTQHHYSGVYEVFIAVPAASEARARELLAAREPEQERRVAELTGSIKRQLAAAVMLTALIVALHAAIAGRWEWSDLGIAFWIFIAVVFLLGIAQRHLARREDTEGETRT